MDHAFFRVQPHRDPNWCPWHGRPPLEADYYFSTASLLRATSRQFLHRGHALTREIFCRLCQIHRVVAVACHFDTLIKPALPNLTLSGLKDRTKPLPVTGGQKKLVHIHILYRVMNILCTIETSWQCCIAMHNRREVFQYSSV